MSRADLHTHSTVSDGRLSPAELVALAARSGVSLLALTDHDNTGGVAEAKEAGARLGVTVVSGVEISADFGPGTMHILGLGIRPGEPALQEKLAWLQQARRERNPKMALRLQELGMDLDMARVERLAGGGQVGRPHFAQALVEMGAAASIGDAFERYLAKGRPAYVPKARLDPAAAVAAIHAAGGVAVLAHPVQLRLEGEALRSCLQGLKAAGLDGMEVWHSDHTPADEARYAALAAELGLGASGGSDFHGIPERQVSLGVPSLPVAAAEALLGGRT